MSKFFKQKNRGREVLSLSKGFTLVETLVSISIFTVSILGLMSVLASGISDTTYAKQKMTASYLAQEGIEYIRNMRDAYVLYPANGSWNSFSSKLNNCKNNNGCGINSLVPVTDNNFTFQCSASNKCNLNMQSDGSYNTNLGTGTDSGFIRVIKIDTAGLGSDELKVSSTVSWTQGSGGYNITFSEHLFNWTQ